MYRRILVGTVSVLTITVIIAATWLLKSRHSVIIDRKHQCEVCGKKATSFWGGSDGDHQFCDKHARAYSEDLKKWMSGAFVSKTGVSTQGVDNKERMVNEIRVIGSQITDDDVQQIVKVVKSSPREIGKQVLSIQHKATFDVEVHTGVVRGPLDGGGNVVWLRKVNGAWVIAHTAHWVS